MGNDELVQDLIDRTEKWNTSRGISNLEGALVLDVYLDRDNFDLHMEVDPEQKPLITDSDQEFKYLTVRNLNGNISLKGFFKMVKSSIEE